MLLSKSSIVVLTFAVAFVYCGINELLGYPLSSSHMFVCAVWSFSAAVVQIIEVVASFLPLSKKRFLEELREKGCDKDVLNRAEAWYAHLGRRYEIVVALIMFASLLWGLCFILRGVEYENPGLANGLTLLSIALLFLSMVVKEFVLNLIKKYKLIMPDE